VGWVEGRDGVVVVVCVGSVRDGRREHGMCVSWMLWVVVSRLGNGDCVCGPGVGADGWGGCCRAAVQW
jgi:hypothetical protein